MTDPGTDPVSTEVRVAAGILHATADLIDVISDFLAATDPTIRAQLGAYLISNHDTSATRNPTLAATIMLTDLNDAAGLLHALADRSDHARRDHP